MLTEDVLIRVRGEFLEMPGLRLTQAQAQRLWGLDEGTCTEALRALVEARFLCRNDVDIYSRATTGPAKPLASLH